MLESSEYPRAKIIGLGKKGKNIIDEIRVDINLPEYLLIDDTETINVDKEHGIAEFVNDSDVIIITGLVTEITNVIHLLSLVNSNLNKDALLFIVLNANSENKKTLIDIIPNGVFVESYSSIIIYRIIINILITAIFSCTTPRYSSLISVYPFDIKLALSSGNTHNVGFGIGIGLNRTKDSILMAINDLLSKVDIVKVKSIMFLFNLSTNATLFEVEDSINMFFKKYNYTNDILSMCVLDEQMAKNESQVIIITSD